MVYVVREVKDYELTVAFSGIANLCQPSVACSSDSTAVTAELSGSHNMATDGVHGIILI